MPDTFLWKLFLLGCLIPEVHAFCEPISPPSWSELVRVLDASLVSGLALLCPFEIRNEGCPSTAADVYRVSSSSSSDLPLNVICGNFLAGGSPADKCTIDCPNIAFEVPAFADLTMDSFNIRGTTTTTMRVLENGRLTVTGSVFELNSNMNGLGGVIQAKQNSSVVVQSSTFHSNGAKAGGAIYTNGHLSVQGTTFTDNNATFRGGAIYVGAAGSIRVSGSHFQGNQANGEGPAMFASNRNQTVVSDSDACENRVIGGETCNGVQDDSKCFPLATTHSCELPSTIAPTVTFSPTAFPNNTTAQIPSQSPEIQQTPSNVPSTTPSTMPSEAKSMTPSNTSSMVPSETPSTILSEKPSSMPSKTHSKIPSETPAMVPSETPSTTLSEAPSAVLSEAPSPVLSDIPSTIPSDIPSTIPSDIPSTIPSDIPSTIPSDIPSIISSDIPSIIPSEISSIIPSDVPSVLPSHVHSSDHGGSSSTKSNTPSSFPSQEKDYVGAAPSLVPAVTNLPTKKPPAGTTLSEWPSLVPTIQPSTLLESWPSSTPTTLQRRSHWPSKVPTTSPHTVQSDFPSKVPPFDPGLHGSESPSTMANGTSTWSNSPSTVPNVIIGSHGPSEEMSPAPPILMASDWPSATPQSLAPVPMTSDWPRTVPTAQPSVTSEWPSVVPSTKHSVYVKSDRPTTVSSASDGPSTTRNGLSDSPSSSDAPSSLPTELQIKSVRSEAPSDVPTATPTFLEFDWPSRLPAEAIENTNSASPSLRTQENPISSTKPVKSHEKSTPPSQNSPSNRDELAVHMLRPGEIALTPLDHAG